MKVFVVEYNEFGEYNCLRHIGVCRTYKNALQKIGQILETVYFPEMLERVDSSWGWVHYPEWEITEYELDDEEVGITSFEFSMEDGKALRVIHRGKDVGFLKYDIKRGEWDGDICDGVMNYTGSDKSLSSVMAWARVKMATGEWR